jgi:hypothetical protein
VVAALLAPVVPASATTTVSPVGFWDSYAYITNWGPGPVKHATPAGPFPNPTTITSYDPVTGAFSGIDNAWDVGKEAIAGVLHGDSVTYTLTGTGVVLHGQGTVTFYSDGTATWIGTWSNSIGQSGTSYSTLKGFLLAGTVQALSCGEDSCSPPTGLAGQPVLVQGTSRDGAAVSVSATSDADGTWSVGVPNGTYKLGPTLDGKTVGMAAFDPPTIPRVTVSNHDVRGNDFVACVAQKTTGTTEEAGTYEAAVGPPASSGVSKCESLYGLTLTATLPNLPHGILVDPSPYARYNRNQDPTQVGWSLSAPSWSGQLSYYYAKLFNRATRYPACMTPAQVEEFDKLHAQVAWYSYIEGGGVQLGQVKVRLAYNHSDNTVSLAGPWTATQGKLTKVFRWEVNYKVRNPKLPWTAPRTVEEEGECFQSAMTVPVLVAVDVGKKGLASNEFAVEVAWWLPFDPLGVQVAPESGFGQYILKHMGKFGEELYSAWEDTPESLKLLMSIPLGLAASYYLGELAVQAVEVYGPEYLPTFLAELGVPVSEWSAKTFESLEYLGSAAKWLHRYQTLKEVKEAIEETVGVLVGHYAGYPVMAEIIRGKFKSFPCLQGSTIGVVCSSSLGVSLSTTHFPNISLQVNRSVCQCGQPAGNFITGNLPWANVPNGITRPAKDNDGTLFGYSSYYTSNPFFSGSPKSPLVVNSNANGHYYASGAAAVANVAADTSQNPDVAKSIKKDATLDSGFLPALSRVQAPNCTLNTQVSPALVNGGSSSSICWGFDDGRA